MPQLRHEVHENERDADERVGESERPTRTEPVHDRPCRQRSPAANQPSEADRAGERRPRPPELLRDGFQEDAEDGKRLRARAEAAKGGDGDDDPSVEEARFGGLGRMSQGRRPGAKRPSAMIAETAAAGRALSVQQAPRGKRRRRKRGEPGLTTVCGASYATGAAYPARRGG